MSLNVSLKGGNSAMVPRTVSALPEPLDRSSKPFLERDTRLVAEQAPAFAMSACESRTSPRAARA